MAHLDLALSLAIVATAAALLARRLVFARKPPSCAPSASTDEPNVVLKGALARAVARGASSSSADG